MFGVARELVAFAAKAPGPTESCVRTTVPSRDARPSSKGCGGAGPWGGGSFAGVDRKCAPLPTEPSPRWSASIAASSSSPFGSARLARAAVTAEPRGFGVAAGGADRPRLADADAGRHARGPAGPVGRGAARRAASTTSSVFRRWSFSPSSSRRSRFLSRRRSSRLAAASTGSTMPICASSFSLATSVPGCCRRPWSRS